MELITDTSFQNLTKTEQIGMMLRLGKELITRVSDNYSIHLYILSNFFVEVWYDTKSDVLIKLNTTDKQEIVNNYKEMNDIITYLFKN